MRGTILSTWSPVQKKARLTKDSSCLRYEATQIGGTAVCANLIEQFSTGAVAARLRPRSPRAVEFVESSTSSRQAR